MLTFSIQPVRVSGTIYVRADGSIFVSALIEGVRFNATSKAVYRFRILQGAVEGCPPESQPDHPEWWGWQTQILVYKNRPIEWNNAWPYSNPTNWDFSVGDPSLQPTYEGAEEIGRGMFVDIPLEENDYIILVVNDAKDCFWDNSGGISFSVSASPSTPVGGEWIPINKLQLLAPWTCWALSATVIAVAFVFVKRTRKQQN
jgi:hypothetical protein